MKFNIITIFPNLISQYCAESILGRAQKQDLIEVNPVDLRGFATDKHKSVDDTPYGGGAGMVLRPEPIYKALKRLGALKRKSEARNPKSEIKRTILLSPRGEQFDQRLAEELVKLKEITFVCGRYEGVDQRVSDYMVDEEVSIGPYVLAGGELGALTIIEAVARLVPGVLGNPQSLSEETHSIKTLKHKNIKTIKEYAQYTKPEDFMGWKVPEVLLSGHHKKIEEWRKKT